MGLILNVYRHPDGDFTRGGVSGQFRELTLVNADGPFDPTPDRPAVVMKHGNVPWSVHIVPIEATKNAKHYMFGGNYAVTSDSRFGELVEKILGRQFRHAVGAVAIHDRTE